MSSKNMWLTWVVMGFVIGVAAALLLVATTRIVTPKRYEQECIDITALDTTAKFCRPAIEQKEQA